MKKTAVIASAAALTGVFASAAVANADTVTVKSGDTVSKLAKDYNTTVDAIVNTNKLSNANLIFVGQKLEIGEATMKKVADMTAVSNYTSNVSGDEQAAKEWIAARESGGSYTAQNGRYYGRYQLDASYLGGDFSPANQDRVADQYVASRYGSWSAAKSYWLSNGWY